MTKEELALILDKHKKWLNNDPDGERANLRGADLSYANLRGADLRGADLRDADLRGAELRDADLRGADLRDADLRGADLRDADLRGAELRYANLRYANLRGADLRDADLRGAELRYADLRRADLCGANIDFSCLPLWCGSLYAGFDDKQIIQLIYHTVKSGLNSKNTGEEVKNELTKLIDLANRFHRADECGRITTHTDTHHQKSV